MRTALLMAAWHGHADAVSLLVSKGGDVNLKDKVRACILTNGHGIAHAKCNAILLNCSVQDQLLCLHPGKGTYQL